MLECFALACNEVNATGGRIVTAPTNGASGIVPAVMKYYDVCYDNKKEDWHKTFLLTAHAIAKIVKMNAYISGA